MKLLVIGNCQARPLAALLDGAVGLITSMEPIIVHLAHQTDALGDLASMAEADLILVQHTAPTFKPFHLAAARIKENFPKKTRIWPNIFYAGQQPDIKYLTHITRGRIDGPLDIYHHCEILRDWYKDRLGFDPVSPREDPEEIHHRSMFALREREEDCDVAISDIIETHRMTKKLFFTFNHPTRWLLEQMAMRLSEREGLCYIHTAASLNEPLGRIVPPARFDSDKALFQGLVIDPTSGKPINQSRRYTSAELHDTSFACYDRQRSALSEVPQLRYTPQTK